MLKLALVEEKLSSR